MITTALSLALTAAMLHATWNLLAKRAGGGTAFIWLVAALSLLFYAPAVLWVYLSQHPSFSLSGWGFMVLSGVLHIGYFHVLLKGYREADLSLVYPLARGSGPLLASSGAILLLGERPSFPGFIGILVVIAGVLLLTGGNLTHSAAPDATDLNRRRQGWKYGLITGLFIAAYTLCDKFAVSQLKVPPIWLDYGSATVRCVVLAPLAWQQRDAVVEHWQNHRQESIGVALLSPLAYILVLIAMQHAPVSVVAPAREASILFGAFFGATMLSEGHGKRRMAASALIFGGIALLALN
jgi:drug/metabolite transporter (DMT)-like permease